MKALFICNWNKHRSKTAEEIFKDKFETKSAGLYHGTIINKENLSWADIVFVMGEEQRFELSKRFPELYMKKRIMNLDIPDIYQYNQKELIEVLKRKVEESILAIH